MTTLSSRLAQRLLALAILVSLLVLAWAAVVRPLVLAAIDRGDDGTEDSLRLIAAYERVAATRPALEAQLRELQQRQAKLVGLLDGTTSALAAANLQSEVKRIVESHGGEIRSAQNMQPSSADGFEAIEMRYDLAAPMSALADIVYQVETHIPYMFVTSADIATPDRWQADDGANRNPKLTMRLGIRGYRQASGQ